MLIINLYDEDIKLARCLKIYFPVNISITFVVKIEFCDLLDREHCWFWNLEFSYLIGGAALHSVQKK